MTCLIPQTYITSTDGFLVSSSSFGDEFCVSSPVLFPSAIVSVAYANLLSPFLFARASASSGISSANSSSDSLMNYNQLITRPSELANVIPQKIGYVYALLETQRCEQFEMIFVKGRGSYFTCHIPYDEQCYLNPWRR
jgi:hypothetical protein